MESSVESQGLSPVELGALVDKVVDYAVIALDRMGNIQTWNQGAQRLKGYSADDIVGLHFSVFYTEDDYKDGLPGRLLAEAAETGRVQHAGWRVRKDGSLFWGDATITGITDDAGQLTGFVKVTRDLTDAHRLERLRKGVLLGISGDLITPADALRDLAAELVDSGADAKHIHQLQRAARDVRGIGERLRVEAGRTLE